MVGNLHGVRAPATLKKAPTITEETSPHKQVRLLFKPWSINPIQVRFEARIQRSMDTRTSPSMLLHRPHQRATGFPPPTHGRHAASSYFSHPPSASYHPYGYSNHCVPLNPSHVQQQQDYTQGSPDAKSTPPQDSLVSDSPADAMRATGCTCKKSRYVLEMK